MKKYFVTAIGTDSGKTLVSAILCKSLNADYWKPIQCGYPTDLEVVCRLVPGIKSHPEKYLLKTPASPHAAAAREGLEIQLNDLTMPDAENDLVIEGAGGILVPINQHHNVIDLAVKFKAAVILVSNYYLGSINHSLLSIEILKKYPLELKGIIFNGEINIESKQIIEHRSNLPVLLEIEQEEKINENTIDFYAKKLMNNWHD